MSGVETNTITDTYERITRDVCNVFTDVTGAVLDPKREMVSIVKFVRDHSWEVFDFRLLIEYEMNTPSQREFFSQPGRMNLRTMLNPAREGMLLDILADLRRLKQIRDKREVLESHTPDMKINSLTCSKCGKNYEQRFHKVPDETVVPKKYRWSGNAVLDYELHWPNCDQRASK